MEPPIDPSDYTVSDLEEALEEIADPEALDAVLDAEQDGQARTTALEAIEARLDAVEAAIAEERTTIRAVDSDDDVLTLAGPDEGRELSERLLSNLSGIRSTLEEAGRSSGQFEARLKKLENEVGDLAAYTEALEEFLDEEGTAQQVVEAVQGDLAALEDDLDDVKPVVRSHAKTLRDHRMAIADLEDDLAGQESTLDGVVDDLDSLDARFENFRDEAVEHHADHADRLGDVESDLDEQAARLDTVESEIESVGDTVDDVATQLGELDESTDDRLAAAVDERAEIADHASANADAIDETSTQLEGLADDVDDLRARLGDTAHIDDRFQQIEDEVRQIQDWREQLGSVLGGAGGATQGESDD